MTVWYNNTAAEYQTLIVGHEGYLKTLKQNYASQSEAQAAASGEWQRLQQGRYNLELTLALAQPDITPETPIKVVGFKEELNQTDWIAEEVSHSLSGSGFTTQIRLEASANA